MSSRKSSTVNWPEIELKATVRMKEQQAFKHRTLFLRRKDMQKTAIVSPVHLLKQFINSLAWHFIARSNLLHTKMCENYGHTIEGQSWTVSGIKCRDCGKKVTTSDELRKASLR